MTVTCRADLLDFAAPAESVLIREVAPQMMLPATAHERDELREEPLFLVPRTFLLRLHSGLKALFA